MTTPDQPALLFHSNAPFVPTGYGQQTALFAPKLAEHYQLAISCFYGLEAARLRWNGIVLLPGMAPDMGDATLLPHAKALFGGDVRNGTVLTLFDVWGMRAETARRLNMACWVPVDHDPAPDRVVHFFEDSGAVPIAMSRFGETKLRDAGLDPLYCPHGIDTETMRPVEKAKAREVTQLPADRYTVGVVAANKGNPSRKCFAEALLAFKTFNQLHPDSILYLHSEVTGRYAGVDLRKLIRQIGIPSESVFVADQDRIMLNPVDAETMAHAYSSLDVLLSPSAGEGFGIPVLEANACGVPAIVTDFTAQPEVCGAGWRVEYEQVWTAQDSWQAKPSVPDILDSLKACHRREPRMIDKMATDAVKHAAKYEAGHVFETYMLPAIEEARQRFSKREPRKIEATR